MNTDLSLESVKSVLSVGHTLPLHSTLYTAALPPQTPFEYNEKKYSTLHGACIVHLRVHNAYRGLYPTTVGGDSSQCSHRLRRDTDLRGLPHRH